MATLTRKTPIEEMVRVLNEGKKPLRLGFNSRVYIAEPGKETFVPSECAIVHFGDWEARADKRAEEVTRIKGLYGALPGMKREILQDDGTVKEVTDLELWDRHRPKVKVILLDGTEPSLVIDDPLGEKLEAPTMDMDRDTLIQNLLAQQQRQQALIDELLAQQGPNDVEVDRPENAPRQRRTMAKVTSPRPDELDV